MTSPHHRRAALKAARLYLEMRGHSLIEQGWSSGKFKIDLITFKNDVIEFTTITYVPENGINDVADSAKDIEKLTEASSVWLDSNKYKKPFKRFMIEIYGQNYSVLNFNDV